MEKATFVRAHYENSSSITHQGNRSSIKRFLDKGYFIIEERNGYWLLNKPASLTVYLKDVNNIMHSFQMKKDVLDYYGRKRFSDSLLILFISDAISKKIEFYMDNDGSYCLK